VEACAVSSSECPVGKRTIARAAAFQAKSCNKTEAVRSFGVLWMSCFVLLYISILMRWHERETLLEIVSSQL